LFINNILSFFYKYILIVLQTININIYLKFRVFDIIFNYLKYLKKIKKVNIYFLTNIVFKICNKVLTKFAKYYLRTKELNNMLYNVINILHKKLVFISCKIKNKTTILLITKTNIKQNLRNIFNIITIWLLI